MSHSVIIIGLDGSESVYFPPHDGIDPGSGGQSIAAKKDKILAENPFLLCHFGTQKQVDKWKEKVLENAASQKDITELDPVLMAQVKEIFG